MGVHWVDLTVFLFYMIAILCIGFYFMNKNKTKDDYYVGGRKMSAGHIGLSVVATDVGGGFSIGLGGLGFIMGLSGSWMLFTGFIGAWLSSALLIPKIYPIARRLNFLSFPQTLAHFYSSQVAFVAGIISLIGYIGFTSSQILAGAKLASATFPAVNQQSAILFMGLIAVAYTVIGGIKAVIYTDTFQWIILLVGLIFVGIPIGYVKLGGWEVMADAISPGFLSLTNLSFVQFFNWFITIVPIWFIGMTLYQRIYACKDEKTAKRAWRIAGLFEWPLMAFMGVILGLFAKIAFNQGMFESLGYGASSNIDPELGLPIFLRHILPIGFMGFMMSAFFSAIMSTADSCLMAASGNLTTDILKDNISRKFDSISVSQFATLFVGILAIVLATFMQSVLDLMLHSYAFMVSGLFVPVLGIIIFKRPSKFAAMFSMITGGLSTLILIVTRLDLPFGLDPIFFGISLSAISFFAIHLYQRRKNTRFLN